MWVILASIIAIGAAAGFAQDPCADADGQTALGDKFRAEYPLKDIPGRKQAIETGKQFLEKYGACEPAKELSDYLKVTIPKMEANLAKAVEADARAKMIARFNTAYSAKNWDEVYPAGKDLLAKYPDEFRDIELVLGSVGYDESYKNNFKYNDETLRYAKMSIADLESGKTFSANYGVPKEFVYKSKDNALGWMNLTIGYVIQSAQKNKKDAQPYLFKATQANSETNKNPVPYELIGYFYFDELDKITTEITAMAKLQDDKDPPDVAKAKVDAIKAKVALANGTSERALDSFSRAYTLGTAKPYKDKMYKNLESAYKLRFNKSEGLDAWIAAAVKKPMLSPLTAVAPISDPEPAATPAATTTTTTTTTMPVKPPTTMPVKPPVTSPPKPAVTVPVKNGTKPQAVVKKKPVKKRGA